jgi:ABC-type multidrug transport system fused ATPase/permease subunit
MTGTDAGVDQSPDRQTATDDTASDGELWLDEFASYLGFGQFAALLDDRIPPSYLYALVAVLGWTAISASVDAFVFEQPTVYERNPYFLLQPVVLLGGVHGAHSLTDTYRDAISEMRLAERVDDPDTFETFVPPWLPWALFAIAASLQLVRTSAVFGELTTTGIVANAVVFPFVYAPIIVQFCVVYVGVEFVTPWRLYTSDDVGIHFLDPHGVGGLRPLGELVKSAYYYIVAGLVAYALIAYAPGVDSQEVSATAGTIFTAVWLVTVLTVAFAVLVLHRFLHREKRDALQRLEAELRQHIENPWDVHEYQIEDDATNDVERIRGRIEVVSATSEYPATFSIWSQLLLSVAIPKAVQLALAAV